jgi:hypothetical protein
LVDELDNKINGMASKQNIKRMLQRERKRIKWRRSAKKYGKCEEASG